MTAPRDDGAAYGAGPNDETQWAVPGAAPAPPPPPPSYPPAYPSGPSGYPSGPSGYPSGPSGYPSGPSGYPSEYPGSYQPPPPPSYPPTPDYGGVPYPPPPPPGYPGAGYPAYPGQPMAGDPYYAASAGTNGMAIASLATSVVGIPLALLCFIGGLLSITGIVLGIVALNQLKRTQQSGRGMAIAGIAVGGATVVIYGVVVLIYVIMAASSH